MNARKVGRILARMLDEGETHWPEACVWWAAWHLLRVGTGGDQQTRVRILWDALRVTVRSLRSPHAIHRGSTSAVAFRRMFERLESRTLEIDDLVVECMTARAREAAESLADDLPAYALGRSTGLEGGTASGEIAVWGRECDRMREEFLAAGPFEYAARERLAQAIADAPPPGGKP